MTTETKRPKYLRIPWDDLEGALERQSHSLDNPGFCLACGEECEGVEPDARRYPCEACEAPAVFGAQEILLMGVHTQPKE